MVQSSVCGPPLKNVLDVELPSSVGGADQRTTGSVEESQLPSHLLPHLKLLWRQILLHLERQREREREGGRERERGREGREGERVL